MFPGVMEWVVVTQALRCPHFRLGDSNTFLPLTFLDVIVAEDHW